MDAYGLPAPEFFRIDDLLDFSNEDLTVSTNTVDTDSSTVLYSPPPPRNSAGCNRGYSSAGNVAAPVYSQSTDFTDALSIPSDDVAELEWLSKFVDDSFSDYPESELNGDGNHRSETSFTGKGRSKRSRATPKKLWTSSPESELTMMRKCETTTIRHNEMNGDWSSMTEEVRRCTHCSSEKTPQWRTGPLGPKTLCNACGVRFKSGRLVPEYRPAASPTFVLTQHSNSHRKVMELRRQKESNHQNQQQDEHKQRQFYHHNHQVC